MTELTPEKVAQEIRDIRRGIPEARKLFIQDTNKKIFHSILESMRKHYSKTNDSFFWSLEQFESANRNYFKSTHRHEKVVTEYNYQEYMELITFLKEQFSEADYVFQPNTKEYPLKRCYYKGFEWRITILNSPNDEKYNPVIG